MTPTITKNKQNSTTTAKLILKDNSVFIGNNFGAEVSVSGEVVFNTGMVGYAESFTDPSYQGQILVLTYPLVGNYGVPGQEMKNGLLKYFESDKINIKGLIIADYSFNYCHWNAKISLADWLKKEKIPALFDIDTRALTKKLRESGTILGKIVQANSQIEFLNNNQDNLIERVSVKEPIIYGAGKITVVVVDCGCKNNIIRSLINRKVKVIKVPWDYNFNRLAYDGLIISNGPGDPKMAKSTIHNIQIALKKVKPIFGICLGNQLLALAAGGDTYKLKFGHRGQNQPCLEVGTDRCYITSQNHGFAVDNKKLPRGFKAWFINANDSSNEGIKHKIKPFFSVQFHPEASPGPSDTEFLFDLFLKKIKK